MRILIHAANLTAGGGLAVGKEIIGAWLREGLEIFVLASPQITAFLKAEKVPADRWMEIPESPGSSLRAGIIFRKIARETEGTFQPDGVFTVFGPPLWRPSAPHLCGFANGLYFPKNPVVPFSEGVGFREQIIHRLRRWLVFRSVKKDTDALWVETENARQKLLSIIRKKQVDVVPNELSAASQNADFPEKDFSKKPPFKVLMVAAAYPHKNFSLLRALAHFPEIKNRFYFQTTLPEKDFNQYFPQNGDIQNLGPLSSEQLVAAYQNADFVFCPSRAEIFSATWIEAMAAGRPLLCADLEETRQLCGDAALYFDESSPESAAGALLHLAEDISLQKQLVENGKQQLAALTPKIPRAARLHELLRLMALKNSALK